MEESIIVLSIKLKLKKTTKLLDIGGKLLKVPWQQYPWIGLPLFKTLETYIFCLVLPQTHAVTPDQRGKRRGENGSFPTWMSDMLLRFSRNRKFLHSKEEKEREKEGERVPDMTCRWGTGEVAERFSCCQLTAKPIRSDAVSVPQP